MTDAPAPPTRGDVFFSAAMHLRLLLRVDRMQAIRLAMRRAIRPGMRVLDAGCGSGILSFLALEAGARHVVAIDRDNVELAQALARENGFDGRIDFLEADLTTLAPAAVPEPVDALMAFVYTNHIVTDEARSALVFDLRRRFGTADCVTMPNRVSYRAIPCDWPEADAATELADLSAAVGDMEHRYGLKFGALLDAAGAEAMFERARPRVYGERKWQPGASNGGYRHGRAGVRYLGERTPVATFRYDTGGGFEPLPGQVTVPIAAPGTVTAVLWVQELWFDDMLLWSSESVSPAATPLPVRAGDRLTLALDERWRATNLIALEAGA
ncbi:hypothetical protein GCM10011611_31880 [Aliidongia dinghuensis]|uniref:Methyltransferase domain-containing protein n=1 Tax=Aliidongia dinghuensis TaxID=1867774 RepID=A0A8J2YUE5_9PROT|nr:methyltransferase domain-containing protein [Aliidongia dinghuensis]GGF23402.1 hypothetical protein GCM10011611_31880 [Aliidongia dinghuensis]